MIINALRLALVVLAAWPLSLAAPAAGHSLNSSAPPAQYRIATVAWAAWSPLHVAQAKGFWREQGLSVEVVNYDDTIIMLEAMKAGRIDLAMDMVGTLVGLYLRGKSLVVLAETDWSHGGDKIIIQPGGQLGDFLGQPIGVYIDLPSCLYFVGLCLQSQGFRLNQFRVAVMGPQDLSAQFMARRLPLIMSYEPWVGEAQRATGARVLATSADYPGCIPEGIWGYRRTIKSIPREHLVGILRGWIKAVTWTAAPEHQEEYQRILNQSTFAGHTPYTWEQLKTMLQAVRIHQRDELVMRNRPGGGLEQYLVKLHAFLQANGLLSREFTPQDVFDAQYVMEALGQAKP